MLRKKSPSRYLAGNESKPFASVFFLKHFQQFFVPVLIVPLFFLIFPAEKMTWLFVEGGCPEGWGPGSLTVW